MLKVLYVDDEPINLNIFELSFKRDFIIYRSESPIEALTIFENEEIDVIVSDLKMPQMNGIEFIREIKKKNPNIKCILLTAYYDPEMFRNPDIQSVVYKTVVKPFKKNELKILLQEACA